MRMWKPCLWATQDLIGAIRFQEAWSIVRCPWSLWPNERWAEDDARWLAAMACGESCTSSSCEMEPQGSGTWSRNPFLVPCSVARTLRCANR
jgi:hypothetical protein